LRVALSVARQYKKPPSKGEDEMLKVRKWIGIGVAAFVLAGCASGVKRDAEYGGGAPGQAANPLPVGAVTISFSPAAQKLVAENAKFNQEQMLSTVRRSLEASGLLKGGTAERAEILVTDFRVRGTFSAVMWGVMAGTDNVTGDVIVRDASGKQLRRFTVNASYGLGGLAGGMDDTRLSWLYEKFAEHTVNELGGKPKQ
jgi:hypothetical protein